MIYSLVISLFLTILIELCLSLILGVRAKNDLLVIILVNICTNPIVVYIANIIKLINNNILFLITIVTLEIIVVFVEFGLYNKFLYNYKKSKFILSFINNISSYMIGIIISNL